MTELYRELDVQMELGECPLWDHRHNHLYWVDILGLQLYRMDWASGNLTQWPLPSLGGGLALLGERELVVAVQTGLFAFDPDDGQYRYLVHPSPDTPTHRLNEGKVDHHGNFWIGTISTLGRLPECGLFRISPKGVVTKMITDISVPNALTFTPDGRVTFADSAQKLIWTYRFQPDGALCDPEVFVDDGALGSIPDGAVLDTKGRLWNAKFGGGRVVAYEQEGQIVGEIGLPATQVTSCAFCGPECNYLAVTTAKRLLSDSERLRQRAAGNVFIFRTRAVGRQEPIFRIDL